MKMLQGIIFVVLSIAPVALANCTDDQIQKHFASSANYHRIVQAVYPAARPSSLLIKVQLQFVNESSLNSTDGCDVLHGKVGASENYTWSKQYLYVSGGHISLHTMRVFSLGTIWPERRQKDLCIRLPQKCRGDLAKEGKMTYFLSKLESVAVRPKAPDPRMNTVKCITRGHGKATCSEIEGGLCGVCWGILVAALGFSLLASWFAMMYLKQEFEPDEESEEDDSQGSLQSIPNAEEDQELEIAAGAARSALRAVQAFKNADLQVVGMTTAEAATRAANKAAQAAERAGVTKRGLVKAVEAAAQSEIAAAAVKLAAERQTLPAEEAPAVPREELATRARVTAAAAKEATALAETKVREEITKAARVSMMEAAVFLMWIYIFVELCLTITAIFNWDKDYCWIIYTVITVGLIVFSVFKVRLHEFRCNGCVNRIDSHNCKIVFRKLSYIVYPSVFIVIHHLLWVFLGMITEPFWALTMLLAICSVSFTIYYMAHTYCETFPENFIQFDGYRVTVIVQFAVSLSCLMVFVSIITLVGRASFDESIVAASVQSVLLIILGIWSRQLRLDK